MILTLKMMCIWILTALAYYGLVFGDLEGKLLVNNVINAVMEASLMPIAMIIINRPFCNR